MGTFIRPYNYRFDGVFARASKAWLTLDDGSIAEVADDERRLIERVNAGGWWVYMEGARENALNQPLRLDNVAWTTPAPGTEVIDTPDGLTSTVGKLDDINPVNQTFLAGTFAVAVTWSLYARMLNINGSNADLNIVNGNPATVVSSFVDNYLWRRVARKNVQVDLVGNKQAQVACGDPDLLGWGACVESGPAFAYSARFPSQPLLEKIVRQAESFTPGAVTSKFNVPNGGVTDIRIEFEPDFASADVAVGDIFRLVLLDTGVAATSLVMWIEGTFGSNVRARAGYATGTPAESSALSFPAGRRLTFTFHPGASSLTIEGADSGNGTFASGIPYTFPNDASVQLGGLTTNSAYSLLSPIEFGYAGFGVRSIEQLTLNSIKVVFEDYLGLVDVLQFNPRGQYDALNPANYAISGSPGLPSIQYVQPGDVGSEVVLFFDANIPPGALVRVSPHDIVLAGDVPVPIESGARSTCDLRPQTAGKFTTVLEVVQRGEAGDNAVLETFFLNGSPPPPEAIGGVIIADDNPASPYLYYYFDVGTTSLDMEAAIEAVAGHLVRVKYPGDVEIFTGGIDENVYLFSGGQDMIVLSLIGMGAEQNAVTEAVATFPRVDIANPQTEKDTPQGATLGTFAVTDTGDLDNDHGRTYLRKRIFRRLSTMRGAFFHLTNYGLKPPTKKLFTPTTIRRLKVDLELQIRQEPGVVGVTATVTEITPGVVAVKLRVQDDNGSFELEGPIDFTAE